MSSLSTSIVKTIVNNSLAPPSGLSLQEWLGYYGFTETEATTEYYIKYLSSETLKMDKTNKLYNIPIWDAFRSRFSSKSKKQKGEIGLEIECEGMNLFGAPIQYWSCHNDGSLRNYKDHPPIEYVLREPIERSEVPKALTYLSKKLKEAGSEIAYSPRTSVHVHVNCQDLTLKQIYQYICLYLIFEERLVEFSGPDRIGNLFCLRAKDAEHFLTVMESAIQTENFNEFFSNELRYTSCNTASLGKFGSLEFRSMRGTVDQELIQLWVDILLCLKDKALDYDNPVEIVEDFLDLGTENFLVKVFGSRKDILPIFIDWPDRHRSMWDGLRMMRDVAYAIKWEKQNKELLTKKKRARKASLKSV